MRSQLLSAVTLIGASVVEGYTYTRLNKTDAALLVVDHQLGLSTLVRDIEPVAYRQNILGHAALGNLFSLPTILTTSAETGPNGALPQDIVKMHPTAPFIKRNGEVNAWDNSEFKAAVKATGKSQIIIAGIVTDVCTSFLAQSLRAEGYEVWANTEASGTFDNKIAFDANRAMENAGVHLMGLFGITMDLMRDWRATPGSLEVLPFLDTYLVPYSLIARSHGYAVDNGTLAPGEAQILV
ncbi:Isochorismatase-like protein [Amylocarpus encephaloides]|uniref:Isochorismatase-like protein n=1 Tax=Amylocarpus encephaloides TaxID=45428 RepID=A0A9P8C4Z2_9HELO|nr:Isochorismatase-like protein [Amylocarpus encephaloides]